MLKWVKAKIQFIDSHIPEQPFTVSQYTPTSKIIIGHDLSERSRVQIFDLGEFNLIAF